MLAGYRANHQRSILQALGLTEYATLSSSELRAQMPEIEAAVEEVLASKTTQEWDEVFSSQAVVAGGVRDLKQVLETGQPQARELLKTVTSVFGEHEVTTAGYRINDRVFAPRSHVPSLGEDTRDVLVELGYSASEITALMEEQVVA
jgi:crotonobetainyl-CoA:carnitine CoA-transferase CaiB-like acyl-CoA transferase